METLLKELAVELFDIQVVKFGDFKAKDSLRKPIDFDLDVIISSPNLMMKLAKAVWKLLNDPTKVSQICGLPYIAVPLTSFMPTKEVPNEKHVKNEEEKSNRTLTEEVKICVVIEDVIMSGSSVLETVECMKKENPDCVIEAYVIIDREQGGKKNLEDHGIKVKSLFGIAQLMEYLLEARKITSEIVKDVKDYLAANQTSSISVQRNFRYHPVD